jgi:hypothetical protein
MQLSNVLANIILVLSLGIQGLNIASMGYGYITYNNIDTIQPPTGGTPSTVQQNIGYIGYVLCGSAFSALLYIILIICKIADKKCG